MNSKIKVDKFVIVAFLLCMVCTMAMQAKAYDNFKVSVYVRAYEVDKMKDIHWLDSTWNVISQQLEVDKIYLETHQVLSAAVHLYEKTGFKKLTAPLAGSGHSLMDLFFLRQI